MNRNKIVRGKEEVKTTHYEILCKFSTAESKQNLGKDMQTSPQAWVYITWWQKVVSLVSRKVLKYTFFSNGTGNETCLWSPTATSHKAV